MKSSHKASILLRNLTAVIILLIISLTSCASSYAIDKGHGSPGGLLPEFFIGIRSKTDVFDIDNVTLEFSWGKEDGIEEGDCTFIDKGEKGELPEECPVVCVAVYFYNYKYGNSLGSLHHYDDYKEIDDVYFVKDFTVEEFNEKCKVNLNYWGRIKYDHTESLTIPKEVFETTTGEISFVVTKVEYVPSENAYIVSGGSNTNLSYRVLENGKVRLGL